MEKLYTSKTFLKMAGGRMHAPHPTPRSAPGHKQQKPSKESGIFLSFGTIFVLFYEKSESKGGTVAQCPPKYAPDNEQGITNTL